MSNCGVAAGVGHGAAAEGEARGGQLEVPAQAQALQHRPGPRHAQRYDSHCLLH